MAQLDTTVSRLNDFIARERDHYSDQDNNRFTFSASQPVRYLEMLAIIEGRYESANDAVVARFRSMMASAKGVRKLTSEEERELREGWRNQNVLHLEIESFLVFAKTLLDRIANFIEDYFGPARGLSLRSHDKWCKDADKYEEAKDLRLPAGMRETMLELRDKIADVRDKMIAHLQNPRVAHATTITADGTTAISHGFLSPKDSDFTSREMSPVPELVRIIDRYVGELVALIEDNRGRTRYQIGGGA